MAKARPERFRCWLVKALIVAGLLLMLIATSANASGVYWSGSDNAIGRANLDGTGADPSFISLSANTRHIAVDATSVYWTAAGSIGRASLDGTAVNPNFISGISGLSGVAADGSYVYWIRAGSGNPTIGRANLDGTGIVETVVSGVGGDAYDLAVGGSQLYWVNAGLHGIASANLDGTQVQEIVYLSDSCCYFYQITGLAVGDSGLYYAYVGVPSTFQFPPIGAVEGPGGSISGTGVQPRGVAVNGSFIYWANGDPTGNGSNGIWRANLDFTGATLLVPGIHNPSDVAVSSEVVPEPATGLLVMTGLLGLAYRQRQHGRAVHLRTVRPRPAPGL